MNFYVLTLFPEMVMDGIGHSMIKRALDKNIINVECVNIRDFTMDKNRRVDDYPYGGGAGMVMQAQPIYDCWMNVREKAPHAKVVYLTPQGRVFNQQMARQFAGEPDLILLCGHYEGIDERVIEEIVTDEVSIGDYILTGGELGAMVMIDAISRLVPGVLGKEESADDESFGTDGLLEYPQYTRPAEYRGRAVPDVLLSGHHEHIRKWREAMSLERTRKKRPDLLK